MEYLNALTSSSDDVDKLCETIEKLCLLENVDEILHLSSDLNLINMLKEIFKIYKFKNKKLYYKHGEQITNKIIKIVNPWLTPYISDILVEIINNSERSQKEYAYIAYKTLIEQNSKQITICMPTLISIFSSDVNDPSDN